MTDRKKGGMEIRMPLSLLFLPVLFAAGLISIPCSLVYRRIASRRERRLETEMKAKGRLLEWDQFVQTFEAGEGTVIEERRSFKRVRGWWTPESVHGLSPHPVPDWLETIRLKTFNPFSAWCHAQYTSPETGRALLIGTPAAEQKKLVGELWRKHRESASERWIVMAPPEVLKPDTRTN